MQKMFTIRDRESQTHSHQPYFWPTVRDAKEAIRDIANDKQTTIGKHPHDFQLVLIGEYNPREGLVEQYDKPENVCWANELLLTDNGEEA
jgi:hypothetical protein